MKRIKTENYNKIGIICLNNTENLNIIESDTFHEINFVLDKFEKDNNVKIILIKADCATSKTGKKVFSAGVNLKEYYNTCKEEIVYKGFNEVIGSCGIRAIFEPRKDSNAFFFRVNKSAP